ncbi:MAG: hypothetical protein RMJ13_06100 [Elusimicrobiota bacterium]|nr:hypothetical protein [Elusimicrobiota bacterium]
MKRCLKYILFLLILYNTYLISSEISIGLSIGKPTGVSCNMKLANDKTRGYDLGFEVNTTDSKLYFIFDVVKYNYKKITSKELTGKIPVFYGFGVGVINLDRKTKLGIRIVGGIEYIFSDIPFNIFFKLAPEVYLIPSTSVEVSPALGIRYIF